MKRKKKRKKKRMRKRRKLRLWKKRKRKTRKKMRKRKMRKRKMRKRKMRKKKRRRKTRRLMLLRRFLRRRRMKKKRNLRKTKTNLMTQDVVEVQGDRLLLDKPLHLAQQLLWQQPHQGLGGESVLGALFVISLGHVSEHEVGGLVDVVDDRSQVALEVLLGQLLEVGQGRRWDVPLPLQVALALLDEGAQSTVLLHELHEGLANLQLVRGDGALAGGERHVRLRGLVHRVPGRLTSLPDVAGVEDQVEVLVDVVHDLRLQEGLRGVVHDHVAQLRLGDVLSQLLDASASGLRCPVLVDHLVANVLRRRATTSTLQTASICYVSTAAYATCTGRKRRAITAFSEMETEVQPKQDEVDSGLQEAESGGRDGRFLLYWITTTSISTSTSYTITYSVSSVACTPPGANDCGR